MKYRFISIMALVLAMSLLITACGNGQSSSGTNSDTPPEDEVYELYWGGTSTSSGFYALNVALCNVINKYVEGVHVTLMETGGTMDDYELMSTGEAFFAQTSVSKQYCLQNDIGIYEGFGYTDSYDMCYFLPQGMFIVVSESSGITSIDELDGQKFNAGLAGSAIEQDCVDMFTAIGVEPDWYPADTATAIDAVSNRQIAGFCKTGTTLSADTTITNLQSSIDVEILSFTDEQIEAIQAEYPFIGFDTVSCAPYDLDYDIETFCSNFGFSVDADVPEDVVYNIVKAFDEHMDEIRAAYPGIVEDPIALTASNIDSSLIHPGTIKYLQEKGIEVPENRIPS